MFCRDCQHRSDCEQDEAYCSNYQVDKCLSCKYEEDCDKKAGYYPSGCNSYKIQDEDIIRNTIMKETDLSREEAKNLILNYIICDECPVYGMDICKNCENNFDPYKFIKACKKAFLDMEKLEKIEHILFPKDNMCGGQLCATCDYEGGVDCINERQIDLCKQILTEQ